MDLENDRVFAFVVAIISGLALVAEVVLSGIGLIEWSSAAVFVSACLIVIIASAVFLRLGP